MRQKARVEETTTDRKTHKAARFYRRDHKPGTCPRCGTGRPCFITMRDRKQGL